MVLDPAGSLKNVSDLFQPLFFLAQLEKSGIDEGTWDAIHLVTTNVDANQKAKYRLVSAVFLIIKTKNEKQGQIDVAGHVNKLKEDVVTIDPKMDIQ